jgi:hypothetical protein
VFGRFVLLPPVLAVLERRGPGEQRTAGRNARPAAGVVDEDGLAELRVGVGEPDSTSPLYAISSIEDR